MLVACMKLQVLYKAIIETKLSLSFSTLLESEAWSDFISQFFNVVFCCHFCCYADCVPRYAPPKRNTSQYHGYCRDKP